MKTYETEGYRTFRSDEEGNRELLANFEAEIITEIRYHDGEETDTALVLTGRGPGDGKKPHEYPPVTVKAADFPGMQWVMQRWGVRAVIQPGGGAKEDMRTCIQMRSTPETKQVYQHIGWTRETGKLTYLHSGGGISKDGNDPHIQTQLPAELIKFNLANAPPAKDAIKATLGLIDTTCMGLTWPLIAATIAPLYGPVDFAIHLTGRTGTYKSELMSLFQSHFGQEMDARNLPGSWSSTANALEAQAHYAKNAPFVIDDFVPTGTSWQVRQYQTNADKIVRAQGNQAGRARLSDVSSLQKTMYPRGIVMSTGEDTPEGHSVRARMLILEIAPGQIDTEKLSQAQAKRPLYIGTTAALIQSLATKPLDIRPRAKQIRDSLKDVGHTRTPSMLGHLIAVSEAFIFWAEKAGLITAQEAAKRKGDASSAIMTTGNKQQQFLESADPVDLFQASLRQILAQNMAHIRSLPGGVPKNPALLGWTSEESNSDIRQYRSHGPCIGWIDWEEDELYLEITAGYAMIKKIAGPELAISKQTLMKRIKEAGQLTRTDDARQRNTIRITAENHPRQVLSLPISSTLQQEERP